jgi:hypothetical protein
MASPAPFVRLGLTAVLLVSIGRGQVAPVAPAVPATPAPAVTEPTASAKLNKLFAGAPPKFNPPKPETAPDASASAPADQPRNGIVHLPTYIVRGDTRLPDDYHMLTPQGRQDALVKRYVGEPTGLDMLLNKYTLNNALWKKIPLLGRISDFGTPSGPSMTPGDRIALDYSKIEAKRLYLEALGVSADVPPSPTKPKDEKTPAVPADK